MRFKRFLQSVARRTAFLIAILLFGFGIFLIWFLTVGQSNNLNQVAFGVAAISAFFAAVSAIATLLQAVEIQRQREAQERPYIIAYFEGTTNGAICFTIENVGNSPAYDLEIKFKSAPIDFAGRPLNQISLFAKPITFLPASKSLRQIIDAGYRFFAEDKPTKFPVSIVYKSVYGDIFTENIEHDLEYLRQATLPGKTLDDHIKEVAEQLTKIAQVLEKVNSNNSRLVEILDKSQKKTTKKNKPKPKQA
jgi:hypothetical protein